MTFMSNSELTKRIHRIPHLQLQRGVTLLENMIALVVLSVGLLGLAGLQVYTLSGTSNSSYRIVAMQQAQNMADRIRANQAGIYNTTTPAYTAIVPNASISAASPPTPNCSSTQRCTPSQLANYDEYEWQLANMALLPGDPSVAGGYVSGNLLLSAASAQIPVNTVKGIPGPPRMRYIITMRWDGNRTNATGINCNPSVSTDLSCYVLVVDP